MTPKNAWTLTKKTFSDFFASNCLKLSASLAFFTVFALPGLLIIILWVTKLFYGPTVIEGTVFYQIEKFVGPETTNDIREAVRNTAIADTGRVAAIVGIIALVFGATSVFSEIQDSINHIWKLKAKPKKGHGLIRLLFTRLISFSLIISLGFILLVSLFINGVMDYLLDNFLNRYPEVAVIVVYVVHIITTFLITSMIFAAIFKVLPDAKVKWRHVRIGAVVTAILFMLGRYGISFALSQNKMTSAYGTAGTVIVLLLWVYYSSMILYLGAAFTHAYVVNRGSRIYPNKYAVWVQQIEVESDKSVAQQPEEKTVVEVPDKT